MLTTLPIARPDPCQHNSNKKRKKDDIINEIQLFTCNVVFAMQLNFNASTRIPPHPSQCTANYNSSNILISSA